MSALQLLASDNYIVVNKVLIQRFGLEVAVILGELASEHSYWSARDELEDGYFFSTVDNIEQRTGLSAYQQRAALSILMDAQIISIQRRGMPAQRYIKIDEDNLLEVFNNKLLKNLTTRCEKTSQQDVKKLECKNNKIKNNKKKNNIDNNIKPTVVNNKLDLKDILLSAEFIKNDKRLYQDFNDFIENRKAIGKPFKTETALKRCINEVYKLSGGDPELAHEILDQSIQRNYQGVFPVKETLNQNRPIREKPDSSGNEFTDYMKAQGWI